MFTRHGHHIDGTVFDSRQSPDRIARCGGPGLCGQCSQDAASALRQTEEGRMKIKIWEKDDYFHPLGRDRIDMDPEVVEFGKEPMVLAWGADFSTEPRGKVTNVRLEDGEIVADAEFFNEEMETHVATMLEHRDIRFGGHYHNVVRRKELDGSNERVMSCTLRAVSIFPTSSMPGYNPGAKL